MELNDGIFVENRQQVGSWMKLNSFIQLPESPAVENVDSWVDQNSGELKESGNNNVGSFGGDEVRPPLPVVRETLYDDAILYRSPRLGYPPQQSSSVIAFHNFDEEMKCPGVWESNEGASSTVDAPRDNLTSLYRPPYHPWTVCKGKSCCIYWGQVATFELAIYQGVQFTYDTRGNEVVSQTISTNFNLADIGQKMCSWCGMVQPESLLEDLVQFMDGGPMDYHATLSHKCPRGNSVTPQQKN